MMTTRCIICGDTIPQTEMGGEHEENEKEATMHIHIPA